MRSESRDLSSQARNFAIPRSYHCSAWPAEVSKKDAYRLVGNSCIRLRWLDYVPLVFVSWSQTGTTWRYWFSAPWCWDSALWRRFSSSELSLLWDEQQASPNFCRLGCPPRKEEAESCCQKDHEAKQIMKRNRWWRGRSKVGQISTQQRACMGQRRPVQSESGERWAKGGLCEMKGRGKQQQLHCRKKRKEGNEREWEEWRTDDSWG